MPLAAFSGQLFQPYTRHEIDAVGERYFQGEARSLLRAHLKRQSGSLPPPFDRDPWRQRVASSLKRETLRMLRKTDIFHRPKYKSLLEQVYENPSFQKLAGPDSQITSELDGKLSHSSRLGVSDDPRKLRRTLTPDEPLRVAVPPSLIGAVAVFKYLRFIKGYNIELNYKFAHTVEILDRVLDDRFETLPDAAVFSTATAATLLSKGKKCPYKPLMIMPKVSHRVVAPNTNDDTSRDLNSGTYGFMTATPGSGSFYFDDLERSGYIDRSKVTLKHMEVDEITAFLSEKDSMARAIQSFPSYKFSELFNDCTFLDPEDNEFANRTTVLFVHESIMQDAELARYLDIAIRDAWLALKEDQSVLELITSLILQDRDYFRFVRRCSGLHYLSFDHESDMRLN